VVSLGAMGQALNVSLNSGSVLHLSVVERSQQKASRCPPLWPTCVVECAGQAARLVCLGRLRISYTHKGATIQQQAPKRLPLLLRLPPSPLAEPAVVAVCRHAGHRGRGEARLGCEVLQAEEHSVAEHSTEGHTAIPAPSQSSGI